MQVDLRKLEESLSKAEVIYLATSRNNIVSARPISPLNIGLRLFIKTSASTRKAKDMIENPNIAVCVDSFYFTGKAIALGSVFDKSNIQIKDKYILRYPDAFGDKDEFIESDDMFFELLIENVSEWIYENGTPIGFAEQKL